MDKEMYTKAANAKSAVELKAVAKEYGIELSDEKANEFYERLNMSSDLSEQELEQIAGGCMEDFSSHCPFCGENFYKPAWGCFHCGYSEGKDILEFTPTTPKYWQKRRL